VTDRIPAEPTTADPAPQPERQTTTTPAPEPPVPTTPAPPAPPASGSSRRALRAVLRWTGALLVFGSISSAVAYGLTVQERTDLPGLSTQDDGRWDYPRLTKPALPSGSPPPFGHSYTENELETHHVDLRDLLLPVPRGGKPDKGLDGRDGWLPTGRYLEEYEADSREGMRQQLVDEACRHIAARGWTTPDGTHTRIYLLQFNSGAVARRFHENVLSAVLSPKAPLVDAPDSELDENWPVEDAGGNTVYRVYDEKKPRGERHARHAYLLAGDVIALVVQSRPDTAVKVPFHQTIALQGQLLS
jgi:hypothetical protein